MSPVITILCWRSSTTPSPNSSSVPCIAAWCYPAPITSRWWRLFCSSSCRRPINGAILRKRFVNKRKMRFTRRSSHYDGSMRFLLAAGLGWSTIFAGITPAQIIPFESNGLLYKTLTKGGVTVMFAYLPAHLKEYSIMQTSISNGSPISWVVKPEDFSYREQDGMVWQAAPALTVVNNMLAKAGRHDVIKLVTTYERGIYGNEHMQTTNGYESRRQAALAEGVSSRL